MGSDNKKVCHLTSVHKRYDVRIFYKECTSLAKKYDTSLIVNDDAADETLQGVKIYSTRYVAKGKLDRIMNSTKQVLQKALDIDADIYHMHDPELLSIGMKLKRKGKKVIFDSHEDVPLQILDKKWIPAAIRPLVAKGYAWYEKRCISKFDGVVSTSPQMVERLKKSNNNTHMVTNYPIIDTQTQVCRTPQRKVCFAGGISEQWNHDVTIRAVSRIDGLKYELAGSASDAYLNRLKAEPGWKNVEYRGRIPHKEVGGIYANAIAGMALNTSSQLNGIGNLANTKLFEYMNAKLPVICSDYRMWSEIIEGYRCGLCIDAQNEDEVVKAIRYLIDNPEIAAEMGENGRKAILEKYNWTIQEKTLYELYKSL